MQKFIISFIRIMIIKIMSFFFNIFKKIILLILQSLNIVLPIKSKFIPNLLSLPVVYIYTQYNFFYTLFVNGIKSSQITNISNNYENLLTPVDETFSIWLVIYSLVSLIILIYNPILFKLQERKYFYCIEQGINKNLELNRNWIKAFTECNFCLSSNILKQLINNLEIDTIPKFKNTISKKIFKIYLAWIRISDILNTIIKKINAKETNESNLKIIVNFMESYNFSFFNLLGINRDNNNIDDEKITNIVYLWALSGILKRNKEVLDNLNNKHLNNYNYQIQTIFDSLNEVINYIINSYDIDIKIHNFKLNKFSYLILKELINYSN